MSVPVILEKVAEISTFELLVKRIVPANTAALEDVARRIVQGYFLTMTNLKSTDLVFQLEFLISRPVPAAADRSLEGDAVMRYDVAGETQALFPYSGYHDPLHYSVSSACASDCFGGALAYTGANSSSNWHSQSGGAWLCGAELTRTAGFR